MSMPIAVPASRRYPGWRVASSAVALAALLHLSAADATAGRVVLRIQAGNPVEKDQPVVIKASLPAGVRTNHILSLGGLELGYNVKDDVYFVHRELILGPKQIEVFDVELDDIWVIAPEELATLRAHAMGMVELLKDNEAHDTALLMQQQIDRQLAEIDTQQEAAAIGRPGVTPQEHITVYERNRDILSKARLDIGRLENLVLGTGQDPGAMLGSDTRSPKPERFLEASTAYTNTAVVRIDVRNTSPTRRRMVTVRHDLPDEIRAFDVLDTGGLDLGMDAERGITYVHLAALELEPREQKVFSVVIRDKWNVNAPRIASLRKTSTDLVTRVAAAGRYPSVEGLILELQKALDGVEAAQGPETVDAAYIAFHRGQAEALDEIETRLNRILLSLPQIERSTKMGFKVKAPSPKTTWMIIYIILGFLAVMSVIFFFRWFGRTKAERLDAGPPGGG